MSNEISSFIKVAAAEGLLPWRGGRWLVDREWRRGSHRDEARTASGRLIQALRAQPLLVVLRPEEPMQALPVLERLQGLGVVHVEIAWRPLRFWADQMAELRRGFPAIALGAASVCEPMAVMDAASAGCSYAVSPVLDPELLEVAARWQMLLVPGVMSASEVHHALRLGCRIIKLFPAVSVGREHWRRLHQPLGLPLPFCIAAGGLSRADVLPWLDSGVDAVALGSGLGDLEDTAAWRELLAAFANRSPHTDAPLGG